LTRVPPALERLVTALGRLPGVGERTATRFAFHLLEGPPHMVDELADALAQLRQHVRFCDRCHHLADDALCALCGDPRRVEHEGGERICVVESVQDLLALERTGEHDGTYHVLHGALSPMRGVGPDQLRVASLLARVDAGGVGEVVLATNVDVEGEATALYLRRVLSLRAVLVTRIATGVPIGGELEYLDRITLGRAFRERRSA
jgi:recombination protein RecR